MSVYISCLETEPKSDRVIPSKSSSKSVLERNLPVPVDHIGLNIFSCLWRAVTIRIYYLYFHYAYFLACSRYSRKVELLSFFCVCCGSLEHYGR